MTRMKLCGALVSVWLMLSSAGVAQLTTTMVSDTVYHADGSPAQGSILISWPQFTTMNGAPVAAGSRTVTLSSMGGLSVALAANAGSNPIGSYYTVIYHLNDGTVSRENWVVPVSSVAVHLTAVRSTVLPLSVAMQTVSKAYVDTEIATISGLTAAHLQSLLDDPSGPFYITSSGCGDADGDATEGFLFETQGSNGTPTCNGFFTTDGTGMIFGYGLGGDPSALAYALNNTAGEADFHGSVNAGGGFNAQGKKVQGIANGTVATDAVAFGQLGTAAFVNKGTSGGALCALNTACAWGSLQSFTAMAVQQSTPGSSSAACTAGQIWTDASFLYVCTATNTIKRTALSSF